MVQETLKSSVLMCVKSVKPGTYTYRSRCIPEYPEHLRIPEFRHFSTYLNSGINLSPQGWDPTAACRASRGRCPELHTSAPGRSSARCGPGKWPPTGGATDGGLTAAPGSWLLGCPVDRPPGVGREERYRMMRDVQICTFTFRF